MKKRTEKEMNKELQDAFLAEQPNINIEEEPESPPYDPPQADETGGYSNDLGTTKRTWTIDANDSLTGDSKGVDFIHSRGDNRLDIKDFAGDFKDIGVHNILFDGEVDLQAIITELTNRTVRDKGVLASCDLNSVTVNGIWQLASANTYTNVPAEYNGKTGQLTTFVADKNDVTVTRQFITLIDEDNKPYERMGVVISNVPSWTTWHKVGGGGGGVQTHTSITEIKTGTLTDGLFTVLQGEFGRYSLLVYPAVTGTFSLAYWYIDVFYGTNICELIAYRLDTKDIYTNKYTSSTKALSGWIQLNEANHINNFTKSGSSIVAYLQSMHASYPQGGLFDIKFNADCTGQPVAGKAFNVLFTPVLIGGEGTLIAQNIETDSKGETYVSYFNGNNLTPWVQLGAGISEANHINQMNCVATSLSVFLTNLQTTNTSAGLFSIFCNSASTGQPVAGKMYNIMFTKDSSGNGTLEAQYLAPDSKGETYVAFFSYSTKVISAWVQLGAGEITDDVFQYRGLIPDSTSLNASIKVGSYYGAASRTYTDLPTGFAGKAFGLDIVINTGSGSPAYTKQIAYLFDDKTIYTRTCSTNVWSTWVLYGGNGVDSFLALKDVLFKNYKGQEQKVIGINAEGTGLEPQSNNAKIECYEFKKVIKKGQSIRCEGKGFLRNKLYRVDVFEEVNEGLEDYTLMSMGSPLNPTSDYTIDMSPNYDTFNIKKISGATTTNVNILVVVSVLYPVLIQEIHDSFVVHFDVNNPNGNECNIFIREVGAPAGVSLWSSIGHKESLIDMVSLEIDYTGKQIEAFVYNTDLQKRIGDIRINGEDDEYQLKALPVPVTNEEDKQLPLFKTTTKRRK